MINKVRNERGNKQQFYDEINESKKDYDTFTKQAKKAKKSKDEDAFEYAEWDRMDAWSGVANGHGALSTIDKYFNEPISKIDISTTSYKKVEKQVNKILEDWTTAQNEASSAWLKENKSKYENL